MNNRIATHIQALMTKIVSSRLYRFKLAMKQIKLVEKLNLNKQNRSYQGAALNVSTAFRDL